MFLPFYLSSHVLTSCDCVECAYWALLYIVITIVRIAIMSRILLNVDLYKYLVQITGFRIKH